NDDDIGDIFTVDSDGNNLTLLTTIPGRAAHNLSWSPDGTKIIFQSDQITDIPDSLYVIDSDGSNLILLYDDIEYYTRASWSPDSSKISYTTSDDETSDIHVVDADGTGLVNITVGNYGQAMTMSWSPDSQKIIFVSHPAGGASNASTYSVNVDGTGFSEITVNGEAVIVEIPSPDGTKILQASMHEETISVYIANADRQNPVRILENAENIAALGWSPNSNKLAYSTRQRNTDNPDRLLYDYDIYVINADGTGAVELANISVDMEFLSGASGVFYWSPDSNYIIFSKAVDGNEDIYIINANGTELVNLTNGLVRDWDPRLSR
ncbi:TolB family protein, partial [Chloroflexota bacterium]